MSDTNCLTELYEIRKADLAQLLLLTFDLLTLKINYMKKKYYYQLILLCTFSVSAYAQDGAESNTRTFNEVRKTDFNKLIGTENNFQGVSLMYDKDKTSVVGSGGIPLNNKGTRLLYINGSLGTTTNLTNLFDQDLLPTFSVGASYNWLLPRHVKMFTGSVWRYDSSFLGNRNSLKNDPDLDDISTGSTKFSYRSKFQNDVKQNKFTANRVYTFKHVTWLSGALKYNNDKYGFIDLTRQFNNQKYDTTFSTFSGQFSLNGFLGWNHDYFKWKFRPVYVYGILYARYTKNNNIAQLDKSTVYDVSSTQYDSSANTTRLGGKSQSYYKGKYVEYRSGALGARIMVSPIRHVTIDLSAEKNIISKADKKSLGLNDYSIVSAGLFVYTGSQDNFKVNIGLAVKRFQTSANKNWNNRVEIITSIPISPVE